MVLGSYLDETGAGEEAEESSQYVYEPAEGLNWCDVLITVNLTDIGMLIALKSWPELAVHTRGAINNGLTEKEISEAVLQATIYCGVPAGVEAMKITEKTILEMIEKGEYKRS